MRQDLEEQAGLVERANRARSEFLSRMSHELRTPLNAIIGFGQLLETDQLSPDQHECVGQIMKAGTYLLDLVNDVLDISRIESGRLTLSLEPVRVADMVGEGLGMVRPLATGRGVRLPDDLPVGWGGFVRADRQRVKQVVLNLLTNAVKYNRPGGEVRVRCEPAAGGRRRLVVEDTGIGIAEHHMARLFVPFERIGTEQADAGTGLGLALTRRLVEAMGGEIGARSEVGTGSTFWIELAAVEAPDQRLPDWQGAPTGPAAGPAPARTVLYVEDNLSNVKLVQRILASRPEFTLVVVMQGGLGLELAFELRPSLVLLDLNLPDVSGEEVLRRLRADRRTADTPVVVISADATPGQAERLRGHGATDYLTKPFDVAHLLDVVDDTRPAEGGPGEPPPGPAGTTAAPIAPLDLGIVADLREVGTEESVHELVALFLRDTEAHLARLADAVRGGDADQVGRVAHNLAGSSGTFGAQVVAGLCRELEALANGGSLAGAPALVGRLDEAFEMARAALRVEFPPGPVTSGHG